MRIYEGNYAYEIEQVIDSGTQVVKGWRYNVYRVRPVNELLRSGDAVSKEAAGEHGRRVLHEVIESEEKNQTGRKPAA